MKLGFEQIKRITQGASRIENKNGYISFCRFNKEEERLYSKTEFYQKTFSTAGIQLEFKTDGAVLNMDFKVSPSTSRTYFAIDIFSNGKLITSFKNFDDKIRNTNYTTSEFELGNFSSKADLGKGKKTVKIVFPWSVKTEISKMEIENASYIEPVKKDKKIIMYGDSITNGYDALYPSGTYAVKLSDFLNAELYNKAIGGETFFPQLAEIKNDIKPDYITVAYGTNDWSLKECDDFKVRCLSFFDLLANNYPESKIFAITPIWRADYTGERKLGAFKEIETYIRSVCSKYKNINVISGWELVEHNEKYFADFRLHPNDVGFKHYAENLYIKLKNVL